MCLLAKFAGNNKHFTCKINMDELAQAYMESKFYYEYERPTIKGFRKKFKRGCK